MSEANKTTHYACEDKKAMPMPRKERPPFDEKDQENDDLMLDKTSIKEYEDPFKGGYLLALTGNMLNPMV